MSTERFKDQNWILGHFSKKILVHCPKCQEKAEIKNPFAWGKPSEWICSHCGFYKKDDRTYYNLYLNIHCPDCGNAIDLEQKGISVKRETIKVSCPNCDFVGDYKPNYIEHRSNCIDDAELWLKKDFKGELFFAYNYEHLDYLKQYIQAKIRERKDGTYMTMVEKLPQFIKSAKNREDLLKVICQLEKK